jgi:beta-xylosidase
MTVMNPGSNVVFSYRTNTLGQCVQTTVTGISTQYNWVKVSRSSDVYRGYYSSNGVNWIQIGSDGSMSVPMSQSAYIGLASCSYSNGVLCNGMIDNVTITP